MNVMPPDMDARIRELLLSGRSVTGTARDLRCSCGSVRRRRKLMNLPAKPNGRPVQFSRETKLKALQLAADNTIEFASAQTGLSANYISHLRKPTCAVKGFEGGIRPKKKSA